MPHERSLSWLHLSDLHLEGRPHEPAAVARDLERCLTALERDIQGFKAAAGSGKPVSPPDLILLSGDLVRGGADRPMFERGHEWVSRFCAAAGVPPERVFVVPGNHDIDRTEYKPSQAALLDLSRHDPPEFRQAIDSIWDSPATLDDIDRKFASYHAFASRYAPVKRARLGAWSTRLHLNHLTIDLIGLNSVWTGGDDTLDKPGFPVIGQLQREALDDLAESSPTADVVLVLQHSPTSYLNVIDSLQHATWLDTKDAVVYCGHLHQSSMAERRSMSGRHLELLGGALYATYAHRRQYSVGTLRIAPDERRFSIAFRGADGDSDNTFGRDTHRYPGARGGVAEFVQLRHSANLGHQPPSRDQLEVVLDAAFLRFDADTYSIRIEKTYHNPTGRSWTHIPAVVQVNALPDDPLASRRLYRDTPLELEAIHFEAFRDGVAIPWQLVTDLDSRKEINLVLGDGGHATPGLRPGETTVLAYTFSVHRQLWGPYFERHIRLPTTRLACELDFPTVMVQSFTLVGDVNVTDRDMTEELEVAQTADRTVWRLTLDTPRPQSRYRFVWALVPI